MSLGLFFITVKLLLLPPLTLLKRIGFEKEVVELFFLLLLKMNGPEEPSLDSLKLKNKFDFFEPKIGKN